MEGKEKESLRTDKKTKELWKKDKKILFYVHLKYVYNVHMYIYK